MAAAAHKSGLGREDLLPLRELQNQLAELEKEFQSLKSSHDSAYADTWNGCQASLNASVECLLKVTIAVKKANKKLVDWYRQSESAKTLLRVVGLNKKTESTIEKKSHDLQAQVQHAKKELDQAGRTIEKGLLEAQQQKSGLQDFSTTKVEKLTKQASVIGDDYDQKYKEFDAEVREQSAAHGVACSWLDATEQDLQQAVQKQENARWFTNVWAGLNVTAASVVFFPLSLVVTAPLLGVSAAAGLLSFSSNKEVQSLEAYMQSLSIEQSVNVKAVQARETSLTTSSKNRDACNATREKILEVQRSIGNIRAKTQSDLNRLYIAQTKLNSVWEKLRSICNDLQECNFEESRLGMAKRLRDVMETIQAIPHEVKSAQQAEVNKAIRELMEMDDETERFLRSPKG